MTAIESELRDFQRFVMSSPHRESLALEDFVCLWRAAQETDETVAAIREGLADLEAGRVRPMSELIQECRQRLNKDSPDE